MKMKFKRYWVLSSIVFIALLINSKASLADPWKRLRDMQAQPRNDFRATLMNGKVYVTGGWPTVTSFQVYDPITDTWTRKADLPGIGREGHGACAVDGILYMIGGFSRKILNTVEAYDPATDTWTRKANMTIPRGGSGFGVVDGIIYAFGGRVQIDNANVNTNITEAYDPVTDTWTRKAGMINARRNAVMSVIDGRIYVASGQSPEVSLEMYEPATDTWTPLVGGETGRLIGANRGSSGAVLLDEKSGHENIYIMGGWPNQNQIWVYNPVSNILERSDIEMSVPRGFAGHFVFNNEMYIMGGWSSSTGGNQTDVWVYNPYAAPPAQQIRDVKITLRCYTIPP